MILDLTTSHTRSTLLAGATETILVILTANVDFPTGSTVTIAGFTGTQTVSSGSLAVNASGLMGTSGVWTQARALWSSQQRMGAQRREQLARSSLSETLGSYADFGRFLTLKSVSDPYQSTNRKRFEQSCVDLVKSRDFGKDEPTAF